MKKTILILLTILSTLQTTNSVKAEEIKLYKAKATAYCLTGTTATGTTTKANRTVASKPEYYGSIMYIWKNDGDGIIKPENFIGAYVVEDTGSEKIKKGWVVDIYIPNYEEARNFGAIDIIYQIVKSEG